MAGEGGFLTRDNVAFIRRSALERAFKDIPSASQVARLSRTGRYQSGGCGAQPRSRSGKRRTVRFDEHVRRDLPDTDALTRALLGEAPRPIGSATTGTDALTD
jgi:hypothetical protein